jgi:hypothetical protein
VPPSWREATGRRQLDMTGVARLEKFASCNIEETRAPIAEHAVVRPSP